MNIGFVASGKPEDVLAQAARLGFDGVELHFMWDSPCDLEHWRGEDSRRVGDLVAQTGAKVLSITTGWANHLASGVAERERAKRIMRRAIEVAPALGAPVVSCNAFGDPSLPPEVQVPLFGAVFGEYARWAEDAGVRIAIENCPHVHTEHGIGIGNIAYSPALFEMLFEAVPSPAVGMEYDPSHFLWLGVDYVQVLRDFAGRIVFVHAKDTEVFRDRLGKVSIFGQGWWRYRVPGLGQVDWQAIAAALAETGYAAGMVIEHEDPVYEGERFEEGLCLGLEFLRTLWP